MGACRFHNLLPPHMEYTGKPPAGSSWGDDFILTGSSDAERRGQRSLQACYAPDLAYAGRRMDGSANGEPAPPNPGSLRS